LAIRAPVFGQTVGSRPHAEHGTKPTARRQQHHTHGHDATYCAIPGDFTEGRLVAAPRNSSTARFCPSSRVTAATRNHDGLVPED
jgi:hypothetical protein